MTDYLKYQGGTRKHGPRKFEARVFVSRNFGPLEEHSTHGIHKTWTQAANRADNEAEKLNAEAPRPTSEEMVELQRRIQNQFNDRRKVIGWTGEGKEVYG